MNIEHYNPEKLVRARKKLGLTQVKVAETLKVSEMTVHRVESGANCSAELLMRIAGLYGIDWRKILRPSNVKIFSAAA